MRVHRIRLLVSLLPLAYSVISLCAGYLLECKFPPVVEQVLVAIVAPAVILYRPLYPVLELLGMLEGEWVRGPTATGILLGGLMYSGIAFGVSLLVPMSKEI